MRHRIHKGIKIMRINNIKYATSSALAFGDYGGAGSVGRANIDYVLELVPLENLIQAYMGSLHDETEDPTITPQTEVIHLIGDYSSEGIYIKVDGMFQNILDDLEDYPSLDDDLLQQIEMDWELEAFTSWAKSDLEPTDGFPDGYDDLDHFEIYRNAMEACNEYATPEYSSSHIPVDEIRSKYTELVLAKLVKKS
jgi:hypothetical protein